MDDFTSMKWSVFLKAREQLSEKGMEFLGNLKSHRIVPKGLRCDNTVENKIFEREQKLKGIGIKFEYTAPNTPQQNGVVERAFATLYRCTRAAIKAAEFPEGLKQKLWAEGGQTSTRLNNGMIMKAGLQRSHKMFYGEEEFQPGLLHCIREMAVVAKRETIKLKLADQGKMIIFVRYARLHAKDVYQFYKSVMRKIILSRDVIWIGKLYGEYVQALMEKSDTLFVFR